MTYADPEKQREYQRAWLARRRAEWFTGKVCALCGTDQGLELDHVESGAKVDHRVWSWSRERREAELAKCRPLCEECHKKKSVTEHPIGIAVGTAKLTEDQVREILASNLPSRQLARMYHVDEGNIRSIRRGATWRHVA